MIDHSYNYLIVRNGGTIRPIEVTLGMTTLEPMIIDRRRLSTFRPRRRFPSFGTTVGGRRKATEVININVKVKDKNKIKNIRNRNRNRNRNRLRNQRPQRPPNFFQRLQILFGRNRSGMSPLLQNMFRPYNYNFNNRFPNRNWRQRNN